MCVAARGLLFYDVFMWHGHEFRAVWVGAAEHGVLDIVAAHCSCLDALELEVLVRCADYHTGRDHQSTVTDDVRKE